MYWEDYTSRIKRPEILEELLGFYKNQEIPIDIRHHCCILIDSQLFDPSEDRMAPEDFVREMEINFENLPHYVQHRLSWFKTQLATDYKQYPSLLLNKLQDCLTKEIELVNMDSVLTNNSQLPSREIEIMASVSNPATPEPIARRNDYEISTLKWRVENFKRLIQTKKKEFERIYSSKNKVKNLVFAEQVKQLELDCGAPNYRLFEEIDGFVRDLESLNLLEGLKEDIRDWEYELKRSHIGFPKPRDLLGEVKKSATDLYTVLSDIRFALKDLKCMYKLSLVDVYPCKVGYEKLDNNLCKLIGNLFQISTIFELTKTAGPNSQNWFDSSKPIIHYKVKFPLKVSCIAAIDNLIEVPKVAVEILTEEEAAAAAAETIFDLNTPPETSDVVGILSKNVYPIDAPAGETRRRIPKARKTEFIPIAEGSYFQVEFPDFQVKLANDPDTSRRQGNVQSEAVTDKRYYLFAYFTIKLDGKEYHIWRISTPIAISSHANQDCAAWGNLLWSYGFSKLDEPIGSVVMSADWDDILELLNAFHMKITGLQLGEVQRERLTRKAKRNGLQKSYSGIFKDKMKGKSFTFWEWFFKSVNLAQYFPITSTENVHGFIGKTEAKKLLMEKQPFTFILRYSDFMSGGISIITNSTGNEIKQSKPMSKGDLEKENLESIIKTSLDYLFLHPNIPNADIKFQPRLEKQNKIAYPSHYTGIYKVHTIQKNDIVGVTTQQSPIPSGSETLETAQQSVFAEIEMHFDDFFSSTMDNSTTLTPPNSLPETATASSSSIDELENFFSSLL